MPTLDLALEADAPKDLHVACNWCFTRGHVSLGGVQLLTFRSAEALAQGADANLPDGSRLAVKVVRRWFGASLEVLRNGVPVPGSPTHPRSRALAGGAALYGAALLPFFDAVMGYVRPVQIEDPLALVIPRTCVFATLAFFARRRARWALIIGMGLYVLDSAALIVRLRYGLVSPNLGGNSLMFRIMIIAALVRAYRAYRELDRLDVNAAVAVFR